MNARKSLAAALGAVVGAGLLGALATPAQAYGIQTVSSTGWAYTDSQLPDSSFVDPAGDAPIGSWADAAGKRHKSRSYFTIDVSTFAGKAVHEADLVLWERSAADCAQAQPVELWRTDPVTATTSWNHAPKQRELLATVQAGGAGQSCPGPLEWDVAPALQKLAARGERTLTVEVRVPRGVEGDLTHGRKLKTPAVLDTMTNTPPTVARTGLEYPSWACGTARKPQPVGPRTYNLMVQMSDVDSPDQLNGEFAVWPVGHEDQRVERSGARFGSLSKLEWDMSQHPDGTVLAWTARAFDGHDYSAWAKPCYVVVDAFAPAAPVVGSALYPNDGAAHGGPNVTGTFTFTGGADVVGYYWGQHGEATTFVPASKPGAAVSLQYAPGSSGSDALYVRAVDSADNRSPITEYDFEVRSTAPDVRVTMGGVGLPSRLDITTRFPGVTGFGYRIGAADEVRVPAVAGAASVDVVFPAPGWVPVEVRAYAGSEFLGAYKEDVNVVDKPHVESADFGAGHDGVYGQPGTFTFRPGRAGVVAYEYSFNFGEWTRIDAQADGTAVLTWTPTDDSFFYGLRVRGVYADGSTSADSDEYTFFVVDKRPNMFSDAYPDSGVSGGVGVPGEFFIGTSEPDVEAFAYQLNDGPEQTVAAVDGVASVVLTPDRAGVNTLTARSRFLDGTLSPARAYVFSVG